MKPIISICVPTWNNPEFLTPCVSSIVKTGILNQYAELIIVNNGKQPVEKEFSGIFNLRVLTPGENLGWEGGLKLALENSSSPFVVFQNDDTFIPYSSAHIYEKLLYPFQDKTIAAVAPITTTAAGPQSIYHPRTPDTFVDVPYLIFYTVMIRREALDEIGGIDDTLPGGDDIDTSIRLRKLGYRLLINPAAFLIHHGFKTGERVKGSPSVRGGWNSLDMCERTNQALIRKHGFRTFFETISGYNFKSGGNLRFEGRPDVGPTPEDDMIRNLAKDSKEILELGCGSAKLFDRSIGLDITPRGERLKNHILRISVADVVADATKDLPFEDEKFDCVIAAHILEHCLDLVDVLKKWKRPLKIGGRLILAVPNEAVTSGIPLDPEHCHAFTMQSLANVTNLLGFKEILSKDTGNGISFVACYEKLPVLEKVYEGSLD